VLELMTLDSKNFRRRVGHFTGSDRPLNRGQLIDAFHILCAESAGANYFLTLDDSLIRTLGSRKTPGDVGASYYAQALGFSNCCHGARRGSGRY